jgi:hypothetical protein
MITVADEDCISRRTSLENTETENNFKVNKSSLPPVKGMSFIYIYIHVIVYQQ